LEWTLTGFEEPIVEFYIILHEEDLKGALKMFEGGGDVFLSVVSKTDPSG
jgi:hypothetical protein